MKIPTTIALTAGVATVLGAFFASQAHATNASSSATISSASHRALASQFSVTDGDGRTRVITSTLSNDPIPLDQLHATVKPQRGDVLAVDSGGKLVTGVSGDGIPFLTKSTPKLKRGPHSPVDAKFVFEGDVVRLEPVNPIRSPRTHGCPEA